MDSLEVDKLRARVDRLEREKETLFKVVEALCLAVDALCEQAPEDPRREPIRPRLTLVPSPDAMETKP